jgi:hypothetical protein
VDALGQAIMEQPSAELALKAYEEAGMGKVYLGKVIQILYVKDCT